MLGKSGYENDDDEGGSGCHGDSGDSGNDKNICQCRNIIRVCQVL